MPQNFRTSFNGIDCKTVGVYKLYGLTAEEVEILRRKNNGKINGSGSDYTIYKNAKRYVYIKLYIHDLDLPIVIDIRAKLLHLTNKKRIPKKMILGLEHNLPKNIFVCRTDEKWRLENPEIIEDALIASGYKITKNK